MACKILTSSSSTCRICLESSFIMLDVFDEVSDFNMKISEMIEMCGDLKVMIIYFTAKINILLYIINASLYIYI